MTKSKDTYRRCASVVLLRLSEDDGKPQLLLVRKPRKKDAWQIPQGGAEEGETIEQAAMREVMEEAGVHGEVMGTSEKNYRYDFPKSYRRFRPDNICGQCIHFVFARLTSDKFVTVDGVEIDSYAWVYPEQLPRYITRQEYLELVTQLFEEAVDLLENKWTEK